MTDAEGQVLSVIERWTRSQHYTLTTHCTHRTRLPPGVDSSGPAVSLATANARANGLDGRVAFFKDDVSAFMRAALERGDEWDIVVLDPPKLAPNR